MGRVFLRLNHELLPFWSRWLIISIGSLSAVLGLASFSSAQARIEEKQEIVNLLSSGFILTGLSRIVIGIAGLAEKPRKIL